MEPANRSRTVGAPVMIYVRRGRVESKLLSVPWRRAGLYAVIGLAVFLLGAGPMWMRAREDATARDVAVGELGVSRMENQLSQSVIMAQRGDYDSARLNVGAFFSSLRNQITLGSDANLSSEQWQSLAGLLKQRDDLNALLVNRDANAADRLTNFYLDYRNIVNAQPQHRQK